MKTRSSVLERKLISKTEETVPTCWTVPTKVFSHQSAAVRRISWTRPAAPSPPDSGWDSWTERRPLWTAGCFCGGGRPARRGGVWAAGWAACTDTVYQHPAEGRKQGKWTLTAVR